MIKISKWSGKCDLADSLDINEYTDEELRNNVKIYVGDSKEPLHIESRKDLIPYYPYVIGAASFDNSEHKAVIFLSAESYVDIEERDMLQHYLKKAIKIYNRCKEENIEFDIDSAVQEIYWLINKASIREIVTRVKENGEKAVIDGIHLDLQDYYRKELANEMVANGIDPKEYGYDI